MAPKTKILNEQCILLVLLLALSPDVSERSRTTAPVDLALAIGGEHWLTCSLHYVVDYLVDATSRPDWLSIRLCTIGMYLVGPARVVVVAEFV